MMGRLQEMSTNNSNNCEDEIRVYMGSGWSRYSDTSEPLVGYGANKLVTG
jgi:hypothetical protein